MIGWIQKGLAKKHDPVTIPASLYAREEKFGLTETKEGGVSAIPFDLLISESHGLDFEASEHAIEDGSVITDHVRRKLRSCTIVGMFTIHALKAEENTKKVDPKDAKAITANRARELVAKLESRAERMEPVRLVTSMRVYEEMLITSIQHSRGPEDGEATRFTMTLREFKKVKLMSTVMDAAIAPPDMTNDQDKKAGQNANSGKVAGEQKTASNIAGLLGPETMTPQ